MCPIFCSFLNWWFIVVLSWKVEDTNIYCFGKYFMSVSPFVGYTLTWKLRYTCMYLRRLVSLLKFWNEFNKVSNSSFFIAMILSLLSIIVWVSTVQGTRNIPLNKGLFLKLRLSVCKILIRNRFYLIIIETKVFLRLLIFN